MWKVARTLPKLRRISVGCMPVQCRHIQDGPPPPKWTERGLHRTNQTRFPDPGPLPLPTNVEEINAGEKSRFSPERARDLSGSQQTVGAFGNSFMSDQTVVSGNRVEHNSGDDAHVDSYDQTGVISLNSVMQSNVPKPYEPPGSKDLPNNLNMPGGSWGHDEKYVSQDLQQTHFTNIGKKSGGNGGAA